MDESRSLLLNIPTLQGSIPQPLDPTPLALENEFLKEEADGFYEWLSFEQRIDEQMDKFKMLSSEKRDDIYWNEFFRRRSEEIKNVLELEMQSMPARVVFRDPSSWSSSLWINVGEKNNESLGRLVIGKNSPVVLGSSLVGVVEYVGYKYSRVRLITDSGLIPSVRAVRGKIQDRSLYYLVKALSEHVYARDNLFKSPEEKAFFLETLGNLKNVLCQEKEDQYLAKGELQGSSEPFFRSKGQVLKGIGFNYDFADVEGPARDLITGKPREANDRFAKTPLLKMGDLLVTTGMDGVFPPGLQVAIVSKIQDLQEGDYVYEIEATPTASNLNELETVFVIPPLDFENKDQKL
ncbi:MAG: rod shape-determining protein MreC [Chlamydiae bacterium]|nr:rod shape-determining protein MreC [Chlamydiota bacterium]